MLKRRATIGILGGGQLGRMMAASAAQLGYRCIAFAPAGDNVVSQLCDDVFTNAWDDSAALAAFAARCDAVTWEFENVPVATARAMPPKRIFPHPRALETAQDRLNEKRFVEGLGGRPARYAKVDSRADLEAAVNRLGTPGILKTRRDGYDGKGQWRIDSARDAETLRLPDTPLIYEARVAFEDEFSVILVRGRDGEIRFWDSTRNVHENGILATSVLPAGAAIEAQVEQARDARPAGRRCAEIRRRADARILRHARWPGVQRNGAAGAQFGPLDDRGRGHQPVREPYPRGCRTAAGRHRDRGGGRDDDQHHRHADRRGAARPERARHASSRLRQGPGARGAQDGPCDAADPVSLFLIYARAANGCIGKDGSLPWHLPADLRRFKALTMGPDERGLPMVMGRRTFESLPGLLPGRRHIVLTRRERWDSTGAEVVRSVEDALARAGEGEVAVIGGAAIFDVFIAHADRIELTEIHADFDGDTFMPAPGPEWKETRREDHPAEQGRPAYSFVTLERSA